MDRLAASLEAVTRKVELYEGALAGGHPDRPWQDGEGDCVVPAPPVRSGRQQPPRFTGHARSGG